MKHSTKMTVIVTYVVTKAQNDNDNIFMDQNGEIQKRDDDTEKVMIRKSLTLFIQYK